jgi:hypothetical protein
MGLFNTIRCDYPLPDPSHQQLEFQTKNWTKACSGQRSAGSCPGWRAGG